MKTTAERVIFATVGLICGALAYAGIEKIVKGKKKPVEEQPVDEEEEQKSIHALVVNTETKDMSLLVLEKDEKVEDKTLAVIDTLRTFREHSLFKSLKAKRNAVKMKEAGLDVGEIADLWFRIKEQQETITPDQINAMILEKCDKKLNSGEGN